MQSSVLTSPENIAALKEKAAKRKYRKTSKKTKPPTKHAKIQKSPSKEDESPSSASEDDDFCIICIKKMPKKLTTANSIKCNSCKRPVHLKCADMRRSYYTCKHCDSDLDEEEDDLTE